MKRVVLIPLVLLLSMTSLNSSAVSDVQYEAIKALGKLNGVALNCRYISEARRIKGSLIVALPKRRALGEAFDQITNEAYLQFIEENAECPGAELFGAEVDSAISGLNEAFRH